MTKRIVRVRHAAQCVACADYFALPVMTTKLVKQKVMFTHALEDLHAGVAKVTLVDAIEAGDVRVTGFLHGGPIKLPTGCLDTEVLRLVHHIHNVGAVPHHLRSFVKDVNRTRT